jgi:hypothetical protein
MISAHLSYHAPSVAINVNIIDWFILCCSCGIGGLSVDLGFEAKFTGYFCILSQEYLSTARRSERISCNNPSELVVQSIGDPTRFRRCSSSLGTWQSVIIFPCASDTLPADPLIPSASTI